ncbi:hypothetical protein ACNTMW_32340 [Planosporangium sp. 12N6]|uniref:hypothetical protein n=1 Tax=Planosporangium spinosum TaxID=3402278 RepID=UPI003CF1F89F
MSTEHPEASTEPSAVAAQLPAASTEPSTADTEPPAEDAAAPAEEDDAPPAADVPPDAPVRRPLSRVLRRPRLWVAGVLVVALVCGWALALHYRGTSEAQHRANDKNRATIRDLTGRLETVTRERDTYKARDDQIRTREDAAKQREDRVQSREDAVKQREDAVTQAEKVQAQNTIHEGIWAVGVDIQPGTYRVKDPVSGSCYWGIYSDANGNNIVANDIVTGGRPTVTLAGGQYFTTRRCGDWTKVS